MNVTVTITLNGAHVPVVFDEGALDAIAAALGENLARKKSADWVYGDRALADRLGWPLGRVQKWSAAGRLPAHRGEGQRKTYWMPEVQAALIRDDHRAG
jgi:hypothetical protein